MVVVVMMVVVVVEGIMCHWVTRATAAIKTYQQELIAELLTVRVIGILWEHISAVENCVL